MEALSEQYPQAFEKIKTISTFVDAGTHFVSYTFAHLALHYNCIKFKASTHFGILGGHHGKTRLDGIFGVIGTKIAEAEKSTTIDSILKLVQVISTIGANIDSIVLAFPWRVNIDGDDNIYDFQNEEETIYKLSAFGIQSSMAFSCDANEINRLNDYNNGHNRITYRVKKHGLSSYSGGVYANYRIETSTQLPYKKVNPVERIEIEKELPRVQDQVNHISQLIGDGQVDEDVSMET